MKVLLLRCSLIMQCYGLKFDSKVLRCGSTWATWPLQRAAGTRPADCLMVFLCVLHEYLCQCAFVQRNAHGPLFVSANPFSSLSFLAQGSFCPFVQHCSACRRSPPFLSVCYLQPFCHISPLPATFLVISEGAAYLFSERRLQASVLPC